MSRTRVALVPAIMVVPLVAGLVLTHPVRAAQPSRPPRSSGTTYSVKELPGKAAAGFVFSPATLTIGGGDTVKWVDATATPHNIVGTDSASKKLIDRTAINTKSYAVTFSKLGTYKYVCQIHPGMAGVITVAAVVKELPGKAAGGFVFSPATLRIHKGQTVLWLDANTTPHNIVGTDRASKILIKRTAITTKAYAVTFTKAGTYKYVCQIHPGMKGEIIVT